MRYRRPVASPGSHPGRVQPWLDQKRRSRAVLGLRTIARLYLHRIMKRRLNGRLIQNMQFPSWPRGRQEHTRISVDTGNLTAGADKRTIGTLLAQLLFFR